MCYAHVFPCKYFHVSKDGRTYTRAVDIINVGARLLSTQLCGSLRPTFLFRIKEFPCTNYIYAYTVLHYSILHAQLTIMHATNMHTTLTILLCMTCDSIDCTLSTCIPSTCMLRIKHHLHAYSINSYAAYYQHAH